VRLGTIALLVTTLALGGCGSGGSAAPTATPDDPAGSPNVIDLPAPPGTEAGRHVAASSGCLACHRLGEDGSDGPGGDLTHVGARLDRAALERVLRDPPAPMPSFEALPEDKRDALVDFLAALK
jgi:menaquinol-cytochrome c reductase cytochrome b/c subunit